MPSRRPGRTSAVVAMAASLLGLLASCAPGSNLPVLPPIEPGAYHLGIGDRIRVITTGAEEVTADFRVGADGNIAVPLLGTVQAAGMTTEGLSAAIQHDLEEKKLFRNPSVVVEVLEYRPIDILGEVNRPGEYPFRPGSTLLAAVANAGGFTYRAVTGYASVVRQIGPDRSEEGRIGRESFIKPGDVITIYERHF